MPTTQLVCGYECGTGGTNAHFARNAGTADSISTTTVRTGSRSLQLSPVAAVGSVLMPQTMASQTVVVKRFYLRYSVLPDVSVQVYAGLSGATRLQVYYNQSDSKIYAAIGGATPTTGATGVSVATDVWYRIDCKFDVSANPWTADVQVDGVACGQATNAVAASTMSTLLVGDSANSATYTAFVEDCILSFAVADYPLGAPNVKAFFPTRDGTHTGTGTNFVIGQAGGALTVTSTGVYTLLDEAPMAVNTSDFVNQQTSAAAEYVQVGFATVSGAPLGVDMILAAHSLTTAQGNMKFKVNDGGTTVLFWNRASSGSSAIAFNRAHYASKPAGGAWTQAAFDALLVRGGYSTDANPDQFWDGVLLEVALAASAAGITVNATGLGALTVPVNASGWYHQTYISGLV